MKSTWIALAAAAAAGSCLSCRAAAPERAVLDNTVISSSDPGVEIKLPRYVHYLGSDRFLLTDPRLGNFDACELYVFVDPKDGRHGDRFYWIQFEAYLPDHPSLQHTYYSPRHATLGGLDFYVDLEVASAAK